MLGGVPAVSKGSVVAVTGAAGFVGGWVVRELLERGYRVRACVRDVDDAAKVEFLRAMPAFASERLTLHNADLDDVGCFDGTFRGCDGVAHVSHVSTYDDPDYVRRTCDHIVASVEASSTVRRVVVTSSVAAVVSEADMTELIRRPVVDEEREPDETNPKRTAERGQGYSIGKVIAQRAFAEAAATSGRWDAITICPGDNVGPIQSAHQQSGGPWQHLIAEMLRGQCRIFQGTGPYRPWMTVDVRDDAACHVGLLESDRVANGERYLAWSTETRTYEDIVATIDRVLPELRYDSGPILDESPERWKERETEFRAIWAVSRSRTTASTPRCRSRSARSTTRSATVSSPSSPWPASSQSGGQPDTAISIAAGLPRRA
jgi:nucleoside-diphosphate-sugar epimerase